MVDTVDRYLIPIYAGAVVPTVNEYRWWIPLVMSTVRAYLWWLPLVVTTVGGEYRWWLPSEAVVGGHRWWVPLMSVVGGYQRWWLSMCPPLVSTVRRYC